MRPIVVSVEVFAAIWSERKPGEENENSILERILGVTNKMPPVDSAKSATVSPVMGSPDGRGGIYNAQFNVTFPPGFQVFRNYKNKHYFAVVKDGGWSFEGKIYPTLHKLSEAVVQGRENAWANWKYRDNGVERPIDYLRSEDTVRRRHRVV
jgi:hypothetical protein